MKDIENLLKEDDFSDKYLGYLVLVVKQDYWPDLRGKGMPNHCGLCDLFKACNLISPKLICPWLA